MKAIMCEITEIKLENNEVTIKIPKDYQISLGNAFNIRSKCSK